MGNTPDDSRHVDGANRKISEIVQTPRASDFLQKKPIKEFLRSLVDLERDDFNQRLTSDPEISRILASIAFEEIEIVLNESGFEIEYDDGKWNTMYATWCSVKAKIDPNGYADWVLEVAQQDRLMKYVKYLGANDPEVGIDLINRSKSSAYLKADLYNSVFREAAKEDPHRAARLFNSTEFETTGQTEMALLGTFGFNGETATPKGVHEIVSGIREETLNSFPGVVESLGWIFTQRPINQVLTMFPLDRKPWERRVAVQYLERRAFQGNNGDTDVGAFLESPQAELLSASEIQRLNTILGK